MISFSFSLSFGGFGDVPRLADDGKHLFDGFVANVGRIHSFWPGSTVVLHHDDTVPVSEFESIPGIRLRRWSLAAGAFLFWRFEGAGSLDVLCVRDADSLVTEREREAVDEWIASPCLLHAMHDHKAHDHYCMLGGMWGAKKGAFPFNFDRLLHWWIRNRKPFEWGDDQNFLARFAEPYMTRPDENGFRGLRHAGVDVKHHPVKIFPGGPSPEKGYVGEKVFRSGDGS